MEWVSKLLDKLKNNRKAVIIINDSSDATTIKPSIRGKILVIKSSNLDFFLTMPLPNKFFIVDIFREPVDTLIDMNNTISMIDSSLDDRVKIRIKFAGGLRLDGKLQEKILKKLED